MKNKKKIIIIIALIILIIAIVAIIVFKLLDKNELNTSIDTNGNVISNEELNSNGSSAQLQSNDNTSENTYNPNSIPQKDTDYVEQYVDEKGNELDGEDLSEIKDNIVQAFKKVSLDKLGLDVNLDEARVIFNKGTTIIDQNNCFVFCIYVMKDNLLRNVGMYAMTKDTKTLYKFNSDTLTYDLIEK